MKNIFGKIIINPTELLVEKLEDYYKKDNPFAVTEDGKASLYEVGVIVHSGKEIDKEWIGKVIYYEKDICTYLDLKNIGKYHLVPAEYRIMVRLDQTKEKY